MKKIIVLSLSLFVVYCCLGQKQFEGIIEYKITEGNSEKNPLRIKALFGKNGYKLIIEEEKKSGIYGNKEVSEELIRFDSGQIYSINLAGKTYTSRELRTKMTEEFSPTPATIAGYKITGVLKLPDPFSYLNWPASESKAQLHVADSLFYQVPEKFGANPEFLFFSTGRIVLGGIYHSRSMREWPDMAESGNHNPIVTVKATATSVKWQVIPENDLSIPAGFTSQDNTFDLQMDSLMMLDTMPAMIDSTAYMLQEFPSQEKEKKQPAKPGGKKNPSPAKREE